MVGVSLDHSSSARKGHSADVNVSPFETIPPNCISLRVQPYRDAQTYVDDCFAEVSARTSADFSRAKIFSKIHPFRVGFPSALPKQPKPIKLLQCTIRAEDRKSANSGVFCGSLHALSFERAGACASSETPHRLSPHRTSPGWGALGTQSSAGNFPWTCET